MRRQERTAVRMMLAVLVPLAVLAAGQRPSRVAAPDKRVATWEKQLVLPQPLSSRISWAERRLRPSGLKKLDAIARTLAPGIAAGIGFAAVREGADRSIIQTFAGLSGMDVSEAAFIVMSMATEDMDDDIRMIMAEIKAANAAKAKLRDMIKDLNSWISEEMSKPRRSGDINNEKVDGSETLPRAGTAAAKTPPLSVQMRAPVTSTSPIIHLEYAKTPVVTPLPPRNPGLAVAALKALQGDIQRNLDDLNEMSEMTSLRLQMTMDRRSKFIETLSQMMKKTSSTQDILVQNIK